MRLLTKGNTLSHAWRRSGLDRNGSECGLLEIAEAAGDYPGAFDKLSALAATLEAELLARLSGLAEPAAVIFMALAVSGGALALYQPMLGSAMMASGAY